MYILNNFICKFHTNILYSCKTQCCLCGGISPTYKNVHFQNPVTLLLYGLHSTIKHYELLQHMVTASTCMIYVYDMYLSKYMHIHV